MHFNIPTSEMRRRARELGVALALTAAACAPAPESDSSWNGEVRVDGALRAMMHDGATGAAVSLAELLPDPHLYGVGALADLEGELTVLAGTAYLSYPDGDAAALTSTHTESTNGAALAVTTRVERWERFTIERAVPFDELDAAIAEVVEAAGRDPAARIPFLIHGIVEDLEWHVIDGSRLDDGPSSHRAHMEAAARMRLDRGTATLIGFYSSGDAGVFTHMDSTTHIHAVVEEPLSSGHVDSVTIPAGTTISLPAL